MSLRREDTFNMVCDMLGLDPDKERERQQLIALDNDGPWPTEGCCDEWRRAHRPYTDVLGEEPLMHELDLSGGLCAPFSYCPWCGREILHVNYEVRDKNSPPSRYSGREALLFYVKMTVFHEGPPSVSEFARGLLRDSILSRAAQEYDGGDEIRWKVSCIGKLGFPDFTVITEEGRTGCMWFHPTLTTKEGYATNS